MVTEVQTRECLNGLDGVRSLWFTEVVGKLAYEITSLEPESTAPEQIYRVKEYIKLAALRAFSRNCILACIEKKHKDLPFLTLSKLLVWSSFRT